MDSPMARGAEPYNKYWIEIPQKAIAMQHQRWQKKRWSKKQSRYLDIGCVVLICGWAKDNKHQHHCDQELNPKALRKKGHISKRNFKQNQTWAAVRFWLIVVVPSPARPRTFIQNNFYYDIFLYAVLRSMLLAPTGALIVTMCYYIYIRPLFQISSQSIDAIVWMQLMTQEWNVICQMSNEKYQMSIRSNLLSQHTSRTFLVIFVIIYVTKPRSA